MPKLDQIREAELIKLAHERFDDNLSEAELKVLRHSASSDDLSDPGENAARPEVRAEFLRWLASDLEAALHIDPRGLRVHTATIPGDLNLREVRVLATLDFFRCTFKGEINLRSAETRGIFIQHSSLVQGMVAEGVILRGDFYLRWTVCMGRIWLARAEIVGNLICSGTKLKAKGDALFANCMKVAGVSLSHDFESEGAVRLVRAEIAGDLDCSGAKFSQAGGGLVAVGATVGGGVFLRIRLGQRFECLGGIDLSGAEIAGNLDCSGANLNGVGNALFADSLKIGGSVFLTSKHGQSFECDGAIRLRGADIGGDLDCRAATVARVDCKNIHVAGDVILEGIKVSDRTRLWFYGARVKNLRDDIEGWPGQGNLNIDGLVYEELSLHEPVRRFNFAENKPPAKLKLMAKERIAWIELQASEQRLEPQPWMQLRDLLEKKGDRRGAKFVLYKLRCLQAEESWFFWRRMRVAYAWLEENPLRIGWSIGFTLFFGTLIFAGASRSGAMLPSAHVQAAMIASYNEIASGARRKPDESIKPVTLHYPEFQPFIYALENGVPVIKLGMDDKWMPDPQHPPQPWFRIGWLDWLKWFNSYGFLVWSRWVLIVWGWVQATVLAAALADRFKK